MCGRLSAKRSVALRIWHFFATRCGDRGAGFAVDAAQFKLCPCWVVLPRPLLRLLSFALSFPCLSSSCLLPFLFLASSCSFFLLFLSSSAPVVALLSIIFLAGLAWLGKRSRKGRGEEEEEEQERRGEEENKKDRKRRIKRRKGGAKWVVLVSYSIQFCSLRSFSPRSSQFHCSTAGTCSGEVGHLQKRRVWPRAFLPSASFDYL